MQSFRVCAERAVIGFCVSTFAAGGALAGDLFKFEPAPSGFYISGFGGATIAQDSSFDGVSDPVAGVPGPTGVAGTPLDVNLEIGTGAHFGGAVGFQAPFKYWGIFHPRFEIEGSSLSRSVDAGSFNGGNQTFVGDQDVVFVQFNNYSDIKFSENQRFVPYFGGGIGAAFVDSEVGYFPATASAPVFALSDSDTAFTTHGALGATYELGGGLELYGEGRYFRIYGLNVDRNFVGGGANLFSGEVEDDVDGLSFLGGVRFRF